MHMRIGSLFSGYGGLDLAVAEVLPTATPHWFVESADAPRRILRRHYPQVPIFGDVTEIDWEEIGGDAADSQIDILTAGYP